MGISSLYDRYAKSAGTTIKNYIKNKSKIIQDLVIIQLIPTCSLFVIAMCLILLILLT